MDDSSPILLVEDNPDDAELVAHAFRKAGIENPLMTLNDGDKAVAYIGGYAPYADRPSFPLPGLVLLDLKLPRRSGFEVLEVIRANAATRRVPIIVLTSSNQENDIQRAYDLGANSYLVKPVGRDSLVSMMHSLDEFWLKLNRGAAS